MHCRHLAFSTSLSFEHSMPNITLIRQHLFESIGRTYTDKEFDELCFEFGVEVDDVETETIEVCMHAMQCTA